MVLAREPEGKRRLRKKKNLVIPGRIILKPIFKKQDSGAWTGFVWLRFWISWLAVV